MAKKNFPPYQPLLLRIVHGLLGLSAILAIITAYWTYDIYDGRWGSISLPKWSEIEGIHGTFGLWTLLIFPFFVIYAFNQGQQKLIQPNSFKKLTEIGKPIWWYSLHRWVNTGTILALTLAVFSGKMMSEKWLPQGELNHFWYYAHLISWLILVAAIAIHVLMSVRIGGIPLILSMFNWQVRSQDSPSLWRKKLINYNWDSKLNLTAIKHWLTGNILRKIEVFVWLMIVLAWVISLFKELR